MHPLVELAKKAINEYILNRKVISPPDSPTDEMKEKAGVFVSLKKHGQLRGCIGTFMPSCENVAEEIIRNAISAANEDPRFPPVTADEIEDIVYSVDVLSPPEKVSDIKDLDVKKYGIIVVRGGRKGLLLPNLEGIVTVDEQIRIAKMKAGISLKDDIDIYRFEVKRHD